MVSRVSVRPRFWEERPGTCSLCRRPMVVGHPSQVKCPSCRKATRSLSGSQRAAKESEIRRKFSVNRPSEGTVNV